VAGVEGQTPHHVAGGFLGIGIRRHCTGANERSSAMTALDHRSAGDAMVSGMSVQFIRHGLP